MRLCGPGQPRPGPVRTPDPVRGAYVTELQNVTRRNCTGQFKYSLYFSLPLRFSFFKKKNSNFLKKLNKAGPRETAPCRIGPRHHDTIHCSPQNPLGANHHPPHWANTRCSSLVFGNILRNVNFQMFYCRTRNTMFT